MGEGVGDQLICDQNFMLVRGRELLIEAPPPCQACSN